MNTIALNKYTSRITLTLSDPALWMTAQHLTGKVQSETPGVYVYALSFQNLEKIFKAFPGPLKPVVVSGESVLEEMREKLRNYNQRKRMVREVMKTERWPVVPNGKYIPFDHQTKVLGCLEYDPYLPVLLDCGTGKTGIMIRAFEAALRERQEIKPGKVLVTAPLSILYTSWSDDFAKFSHLNHRVLWTPMQNKKNRSEEVFPFKDYGPKPEGSITVKTKKRAGYVNGAQGLVVKRLNALQKLEKGWEHAEIKEKVAIMPDGQEIPFGLSTFQTVTKQDRKREWVAAALQDPSVDVFIINHDGVKIYRELLKAHQFEWVCVDESTKIKNVRSETTSAHLEISWDAKRRTIMSGTPNPNGYEDLWAQFYFLDRGETFGTSIHDFRNEYCTPVKVGHFGGKDSVKWHVDAANASRIIAKVQETSVCIDQRDCLDLPPRQDLKRLVYLSPEHSEVYRKMEKDLITEIENESGTVTVEAVNTLSKLMKLRQITSGFIIDGATQRNIPLQWAPKIDELKSFIEELGNKKVVVIGQFTDEIAMMRSSLNQYKVQVIQGGMDPLKRKAAVDDFSDPNGAQVIILQAAAAAHGITLTAAQYMIYQSLDYNFEFYYQTGKRIERYGQKLPMFMYHVLARTSDNKRTIDEDLLDVLESKRKARDSLYGKADVNDTFASDEEIAKELTARLKERHQ